MNEVQAEKGMPVDADAVATTTTPKPKSKRGFASMDKEKLRALCSKGGKAAQALGVGHRFTHDEAVAAGKIGGTNCAKKYGKGHMAALGRKGGSN